MSSSLPYISAFLFISSHCSFCSIILEFGHLYYIKLVISMKILHILKQTAKFWHQLHYEFTSSVITQTAQSTELLNCKTKLQAKE